VAGTGGKTLGAGKWLTGSVFAIALASLFSDACYEGIIPLLPALVTSLGGGPAVLGLMEGLADGLSFPFKLLGGSLADRTNRRRAWTFAGYTGLGVLFPAVAFAHSIAGVITLRATAWMSRGFRSPIRDTLLVDDTNPRYVNRAFGFQRALDSVGAVIGPAVAIALISHGWPLRNAIVLGLIPGVLAGCMYFFVRERPRTVPPKEPVHLMFSGLPRAFQQYLVAAGVFGAGNFSATLLVLVATKAFAAHLSPALAVSYATLLYLGHNVIYASAAYPASVVSERIGTGRLLLLAFAMFAAVGLLLAFASTAVWAIIVAFVLAALAVATLDPMEATFASYLLPAQRRGTGFGVLASVNGFGDFISSAGVGALWQFFGPLVAFGAAGVLCAGGALLLAPLVSRTAPRSA
jgi:MFS family permease